MAQMSLNIAPAFTERRLRALAGALALFSSQATGLERKPTQDVHTNYVLYCAGCHGLDARGVKQHVPNLTATLPVFLTTDSGRRFVLSVPGVAHSSLDDGHLLEVLNLLVNTVNLQQATAFAPITADELHSARIAPAQNVRATRNRILQTSAAGQDLINY